MNTFILFTSHQKYVILFTENQNQKPPWISNGWFFTEKVFEELPLSYGEQAIAKHSLGSVYMLNIILWFAKECDLGLNDILLGE